MFCKDCITRLQEKNFDCWCDERIEDFKSAHVTYLTHNLLSKCFLLVTSICPSIVLSHQKTKISKPKQDDEKKATATFLEINNWFSALLKSLKKIKKKMKTFLGQIEKTQQQKKRFSLICNFKLNFSRKMSIFFERRCKKENEIFFIHLFFIWYHSPKHLLTPPRNLFGRDWTKTYGYEKIFEELENRNDLNC